MSSEKSRSCSSPKVNGEQKISSLVNHFKKNIILVQIFRFTICKHKNV